MVQNKQIGIPIICENSQCLNFDSIINVVSEVDGADMDLFYEGYNGSENADYCQACGELGVAKDAILL